jgi:hypothetical protein
MVFTERHVEHDVGGLAAGARQRFQSARVRGTSPPNSAISFSDSADVLRLVAIKTDVLMYRGLSSPSASIFAACRPPRTARVALLTPVGRLRQTTATSR